MHQSGQLCLGLMAGVLTCSPKYDSYTAPRLVLNRQAHVQEEDGGELGPVGPQAAVRGWPG